MTIAEAARALFGREAFTAKEFIRAVDVATLPAGVRYAIKTRHGVMAMGWQLRQAEGVSPVGKRAGSLLWAVDE